MWRVVLFLAASLCQAAAVCEPDAAIQSRLDIAEAAPILDAADFDHNIATFAALREAHEDDLFVHESYQDAVRRHGIEGHLKAMAEEYQLLATNHADELRYRYLAARALIGRGTPSAIQSLSAIGEENPNFAPAHRALAEIYGSAAFRDPAQESRERKRFLALCPKTRLTEVAFPPPELSALLDRAERLLHDNGDAEQIAQMAADAIRADEWRLQRIRAFDWYSTELKRHSVREMQSEYWRLWDLQVRCFRKNGQMDKAAEVLAAMRQRAAQLGDPERLAQVKGLAP